MITIIPKRTDKSKSMGETMEDHASESDQATKDAMHSLYATAMTALAAIICIA